MTFLSICVPTYNRAKELKKLFDSTLNHEGVELVICDDGSSDNTKKIIESYSLILNIKYFYQENKGRAHALNFAIGAASGEFTMIMDSDDYFTYNGLSLIINYLKKNPYSDSFIFGVKAVKRNQVYRVHFPARCASNFIAARADYKIRGDLKEVVRSAVLKSVNCLPPAGCRRVPTSLLWALVGEKVDCISVDEIVAVKEYLVGGMSDKILELKTSNSTPMVHLYLLLSLSGRYKSRLSRWRYRILWSRYSFHSGNFSNVYWWQKFVSPIGLFFYLLDRCRLKLRMVR